VSDEPLIAYERAAADQLFEVILPDSTPLDKELPEDGRGYCEWCLPAHLLNQWPRRRLDMADVEALEAEQARRPGRSADLPAALVQERGNPFGPEEQLSASDGQPLLLREPDQLPPHGERLN
jgi:hypothetical protein